MVLDIRGLAFNVHKPYIIMACIIRCYSIMHIKQVYVCSQKKKSNKFVQILALAHEPKWKKCGFFTQVTPLFLFIKIAHFFYLPK